MIVWIENIETKTIQSGENAGTSYDVATVKDGENKERKFSLFDPELKKLFAAAKETGSAIDLRVEKNKRGFLNAVEGKLIAQEIAELPSPPPPDETLMKESAGDVVKPSPQEIGMWWKELGEWLRMKENEKGADPFWLEMRTAYFAHMFMALPLKIKTKETNVKDSS